MDTAAFFWETVNPCDCEGTVEVDRFEIPSHKKGGWASL